METAYFKALRDIDSWPKVDMERIGLRRPKGFIGPVNNDACPCAICKGRSLGQVGYENYREALLRDGLIAWPENNWGDPAGTPLAPWGDLTKEQREFWERQCAPDEGDGLED